jgi:hypothetical protein
VLIEGVGGSGLGLSMWHVGVAGGLSDVPLVEAGLVVRLSPPLSMVWKSVLVAVRDVHAWSG